MRKFPIPYRQNILAAAGLATCVAVALTGCDSGSTSTGSTYETAAQGPTCNASWSRETYETARSTPLVRDAAVRADGLHIVVSRGAWAILKLDERDRLVSAFDCAIAGPNYLKAIIVEDSSGSVLKAYGPLDLHAARKLQP